jgi:GTP cyclohydrolase I
MMEINKDLFNKMPDIASEKNSKLKSLAMNLDWVGMQNIEIPVQFNGQVTPGKASAFVSLDDGEARGIHMSRLFKIIQDHVPSEEMSFSCLKKIVQEFLSSHQGLSSAAKVSIDFSVMVKRPALKSQNAGWRTYPVSFSAEKKADKEIYSLKTTIIYSSTCPASAALARQLIQENFKSQFADKELSSKSIFDWLGDSKGIIATPHSQRSYAEVCVQTSPDSEISPLELINLIEDSLQTSVQTVVKREDEQQFALINGQNLMFCEDAARRLKSTLASSGKIISFSGLVRHIESLHPHDASSYFSSI